MGLPAFLSAVRELIMDIDDIPGSPPEREQRYREAFPLLSDIEIEDLAKIPRDKFKIYTSTIFHGERAMVTNHFPCTLAYLKQHWEKVYGAKFSLFEMIRALHRVKPWRSNLTDAFARNFVAFVTEDLAQMTTLLPFLPDLAELEEHAIHIKRAPDETPSARESIPRAELLKLSVGDLMSLSYFLPISTREMTFEYDVVAAYRYFHTNDEAVLSAVPAGKIFVVGGRNAALRPRWEYLSPSLHEYFSGLARSEYYSVGDLLQTIAVSLPDAESKPEEELFIEALSKLVDLVEIGAVVIKS